MIPWLLQFGAWLYLVAAVSFVLGWSLCAVFAILRNEP